MSFTKPKDSHNNICAKQEKQIESSPGIKPSSSYTFAIYKSESSKWTTSSQYNSITPLIKSKRQRPSPCSVLSDDDEDDTGNCGESSVSHDYSGATPCPLSESAFASSEDGESSRDTSSKSDSKRVGQQSASNSIVSEENADRSVKDSYSSGRGTDATDNDSSERGKSMGFCDSVTAAVAREGSSIRSSCSYSIGGSCAEVKASESKRTEAAMSTNSQTNASAAGVNKPGSKKSPSSPVKHVGGGSKSKSRHSSTSDTTCVTPVGSNSIGLSGTGSVADDSDGVDKAHSIRVTRKIFNNWKSACGKTKDKTKDFIRRWKTLPENQAESDGNGRETEESIGVHPRLTPLNSSSVNVDLQGGSGVLASMEATGGNHALINNSGGGATVAPGGGGGSNTPDTTTAPPVHKAHSNFSKIKSLTKKFSQDIPSEEHPLSLTTTHAKPSAGWSVHVWATYVQRDNEDENLLSKKDEKPGRDLLSDFQKTKLTHFFRHVLDMNHDDVISAVDFVALNQRIKHYIEWSPECIEFHVLKEVHSGFLECFLNQPLDETSGMYYCSSERETREHVNLDDWLDVWGTLLTKARVLEDLPLWLQYFPKILYRVINKSGSEKISKEELRAFYTTFLGIDFRVVNETLDSIYNAMTDGGRNKITYHLFKLCFTNFLLGRYPHGPGQYLFGICSPQSLHCNFPIDYSALNTPTDDLKPYDPSQDRDHSRRSVVV